MWLRGLYRWFGITQATNGGRIGEDMMRWNEVGDVGVWLRCSGHLQANEESWKDGCKEGCCNNQVVMWPLRDLRFTNVPSSNTSLCDRIFVEVIEAGPSTSDLVHVREHGNFFVEWKVRFLTSEEYCRVADGNTICLNFRQLLSCPNNDELCLWIVD